jgi:hypothetical protein
MRGGYMSSTWLFLVAVLGACVGGFLALMLYAMCYVAGAADLEREAYLAGWEAARDKGRGEEAST